MSSSADLATAASSAASEDVAARAHVTAPHALDLSQAASPEVSENVAARTHVTEAQAPDLSQSANASAALMAEQEAVPEQGLASEARPDGVGAAGSAGAGSTGTASNASELAAPPDAQPHASTVEAAPMASPAASDVLAVPAASAEPVMMGLEEQGTAGIDGVASGAPALADAETSASRASNSDRAASSEPALDLALTATSQPLSTHEGASASEPSDSTLAAGSDAAPATARMSVRDEGADSSERAQVAIGDEAVSASAVTRGSEEAPSAPADAATSHGEPRDGVDTLEASAVDAVALDEAVAADMPPRMPHAEHTTAYGIALPADELGEEAESQREATRPSPEARSSDDALTAASAPMSEAVAFADEQSEADQLLQARTDADSPVSIPGAAMLPVAEDPSVTSRNESTGTRDSAEAGPAGANTVRAPVDASSEQVVIGHAGAESASNTVPHGVHDSEPVAMDLAIAEVESAVDAAMSPVSDSDEHAAPNLSHAEAEASVVPAAPVSTAHTHVEAAPHGDRAADEHSAAARLPEESASVAEGAPVAHAATARLSVVAESHADSALVESAARAHADTEPGPMSAIPEERSAPEAPHRSIPPAPRAPIELDDLPASSSETMELASTWEFVGWQGGESNGTIGHVPETTWADRAVDLDGPALSAVPTEPAATEMPLASAWDFIQQPWQPSAGPASEVVSSLLAAASASTDTPSVGPAVTAEQVLAALEGVGTQGTLGKVLLAYCAGRFRRAFLLGESFGLARVGHAWGPGSDSPAVSALKVDLEAPSLLTAAMAAGTGPSVFKAPDCSQDEAIFSALGGEASSHLLVATVRNRGRPVAFVIADHGAEPVDASALEELTRVIEKASEAYERLPAARGA